MDFQSMVTKSQRRVAKHNSIPLLADTILPTLHINSSRTLLLEVVRSSLVGCSILTSYATVIFGCLWTLFSYVTAWLTEVKQANFLLDVMIWFYAVLSAIIFVTLWRKLWRKAKILPGSLMKEQIICAVLCGLMALLIIVISGVRIITAFTAITLTVWLHTVEVVAMIAYEWSVLLLGLMLGGSLGQEVNGVWFYLWRCAIFVCGSGTRIGLFFRALRLCNLTFDEDFELLMKENATKHCTDSIEVVFFEGGYFFLLVLWMICTMANFVRSHYSLGKVPYSKTRARQLLFRVLTAEIVIILLLVTAINVTAAWTNSYIPDVSSISISILISQGFICMLMMKVFPAPHRLVQSRYLCIPTNCILDTVLHSVPEVDYGMITAAARGSFDAYRHPSWAIKTTNSSDGVVEGIEAKGIAVTDYHGDFLTDTHVTILWIPSEKLLVIAFRGTNSLQNVRTDCNFGLALLPGFEGTIGNKLRNGCRVHAGFLRAYMSIRHWLLKAIKRRLKILQAGPVKLLITGHSLGGAIATIATLDLSFALDHTLFKKRTSEKKAEQLGNPPILPPIPRKIAKYYSIDKHTSVKTYSKDYHSGKSSSPETKIQVEAKCYENDLSRGSNDDNYADDDDNDIYISEIASITFGSPRVGNVRFAKLFNRFVPTAVRFALRRDIITAHPKLCCLYKHVRHELMIDDRGDVILDPSPMERRFRPPKSSLADHRLQSYVKALTDMVRHSGLKVALYGIDRLYGDEYVNGSASEDCQSVPDFSLRSRSSSINRVTRSTYKLERKSQNLRRKQSLNGRKFSSHEVDADTNEILMGTQVRSIRSVSQDSVWSSPRFCENGDSEDEVISNNYNHDSSTLDKPNKCNVSTVNAPFNVNIKQRSLWGAMELIDTGDGKPFDPQFVEAKYCIVFHGLLRKRAVTSSRNSWKLRHFELCGNILSYFGCVANNSLGKTGSQKPNIDYVRCQYIRSLTITSCSSVDVIYNSQFHNCFELSTPSATLRACAPTQSLLNEWMKVIRQAIAVADDYSRFDSSYARQRCQALQALSNV